MEDLNTNKGYITLDVKLKYQNGLFPFIVHKLNISNRIFHDRTEMLSQKYSFY